MKVPSLRHDFGSEEWMAVGRLLSYGYQNVGYWPVSIADSFFRQCIFPQSDLSTDKLMKNFYSHISITDVDVFQAAVKDFESVEEDDLLESLDAHDCRTKPNAENVKSVLLEIAHKEIIQTPMFVCDCWRDILQKTNVTVEKLEHIYSVLIPNNKKVLHMLKFSDNDKQTSEVSKYLKMYVREMDIKTLKLFLRFCTGSDLMTEENITVEFAHMEGLARRPIGHTCGCVLELAYHYDNYMEFRSEFEGVLQSNIWVMDIV